MSLFGPPNIIKYRKEGRIRKLVKLLNNKDQQIVDEALNALNDITNDETLQFDRKENWFLHFHYAGAIKAINKLNKEQQSSIAQLTQKIIKEKEYLERKNEQEKYAIDELKRQFEDTFKDKRAYDKFFPDLMNILGKNKEFLYTLKYVNTHSMGLFNGVIVTNDEIIYFELNLFHNVMGIRFDDIHEYIFKDGFFNKNIKIKNKSGDYMEIPVDDNNKEMIAFIESKHQENRIELIE